MIRGNTRQPGRRPAASTVEFACVVPVFLLFLLGILEYSRFVFTAQMLNNAAREGARYAVVTCDTETTAGIQNYVDQFLQGQGANQLVNYDKTTAITVYQANPTTGLNTGTSWQNSNWGSAIGVQISGTYQPVVPGLLKLSSSFTIQASCVATVEE